MEVPVSAPNFDKNGLIVRLRAVDGAVREFMPQLIRIMVLH